MQSFKDRTVLVFNKDEAYDNFEAMNTVMALLEAELVKLGDETRKLNAKSVKETDPSYKLNQANVRHYLKARAHVQALRNALYSK